jgi:magnesium transporter
MPNIPETETWRDVDRKLAQRDALGALLQLETMTAEDQVWALARLGRRRVLPLLLAASDARAATYLRQMHVSEALALLRAMEPARAAAIIEKIPEDEQSVLLLACDDRLREAAERRDTSPEAMHDALRAHAPDTAGGLMSTELLRYPEFTPLRSIHADLRGHAESYRHYDIQYVYIIDDAGHLHGVLPLRELVLADPDTTAARVMINSPVTVRQDATLDELRGFFVRYSFLAAPVVDADGHLVGVVHRAAVDRAIAERHERDRAKMYGIIGGEEIRSMPLHARAGKRLAWLTINVVLNLLAATIIAMHRDVIEAVIALAVFLPIISDMAGCSGNQAVAVTMREVTLGLIRPCDALRVIAKECVLGLLNGVALGLLLGVTAWAWWGSGVFGVVVGAAMAISTVLSVLVGGAVPLVLKRLGIDPALASNPIVSTLTDVAGFYFLLSIAGLMLERMT